MTTQARSAVRLPAPRAAHVRTTDLWAVVGFIIAVTLGLWIQHGGLDLLTQGFDGILRALGQLTGFAAALAALAALVLTSRPRFLERRYGLDQMLAWHRWAGIITVFTVVAHTIIDTIVWGQGTGEGFFPALGGLLTGESWMVAALVGTAIFVIIGLSSWKRIRRAVSYETWYFIHTLGYLAVLMGFGHQLTLGTDIAGDTVAFWWWTGVAIATLLVILYARFGVILRSIARPFVVTKVVREATDIGSITVNSKHLRNMRVRSGQFFMLRPMSRGLWWQAHPYSISSAPTTAGLRFTIKGHGSDDSTAILNVKTGSKVLLEGPYGVFTIDQAAGSRVLMVAGGVGIAPLRAILEDCHSGQNPIVLVRVREEKDLPHLAELERLVKLRDGELHVLAGRREWFAKNDPFHAAALKTRIPDIASRHVFICGPASLESAVISGLRKSGVPTSNIHLESFGI